MLIDQRETVWIETYRVRRKETLMALPTAYLTSTKNLEGILNAIQSAKAPPKFTQRFLEDLGFKGNSDRLVINVLKALGFLSPDGSPTARYFEFLDQSQAGRVLAEGMEDAYADLFQLNRNAHKLDRSELKGKVKTLTQGKSSDGVVNMMVNTFQAFASLADFETSKPQPDPRTDEREPDRAEEQQPRPPRLATRSGAGIPLGGLVYNVELHLPESRDPAVYETLFRALKEHLLS
jgi:Family of unknown function (DUF5343)